MKLFTRYWIQIFTFISAGHMMSLADIAPLKVGNEWRYKGQMESHGYWAGPRFSRMVEKLTVKVASKQTFTDSTLYKIQFVDSLSRRAIVSNTVGDTISLKDTVISFSLSVVEKGGVIDVEPGFAPSGLPYQIFPNSMENGLLFNNFFTSHSIPFGDTSTVLGATSFGHVWQSKNYHEGAYYNKDHIGWYLENVGLFWTHWKQVAGCDGTVERELLLTSFNGKPIPMGVNPPLFMKPLAKEAKIVCSIYRKHLAAISAQEFRNGAFHNLLGRVNKVTEK